MSRYELCDFEHKHSGSTNCALCHKYVDLLQSHYLRLSFSMCEPVHTTCAIAAILEDV